MASASTVWVISDQKAASAYIARCIAASARRDLGLFSGIVTLCIDRSAFNVLACHVVDHVTRMKPNVARRLVHRVPVVAPRRGHTSTERRAAVLWMRHKQSRKRCIERHGEMLRRMRTRTRTVESGMFHHVMLLSKDLLYDLKIHDAAC